jgi:hypothetical protein
MSKGPCTFRKSDIRRGVQALESAGVEVARVEVQAGKIVFVPRDEATDIAPADGPNEWDGVQ